MKMKTSFTQSFFLIITIIISFNTYFAKAEYGLENVIVEKYYVSDADDEDESVGVLPAGSVTYRIYLDLLPGYTFQSCYGDYNTNPAVGNQTRNKLFIRTTTSFFNNEDRGLLSPAFDFKYAKENTVMLDSWISCGAACNGYFGVLKNEDDGKNTVINKLGILKNADASAGIALTSQDGLIAGNPGVFSAIGIPDSIASIFKSDSQLGNNFEIYNGGWNSPNLVLGGAMGFDSLINKVLIAQVTTDGELTFELNVQIGLPRLLYPFGEYEKYVASNPFDTSFIEFNGLSYPKGHSVFIDNTTLDKSNALSVKVFPNPSNNIFKLNITTSKIASNVNYKVYNVIGNLVIQNTLNINNVYTQSIDMSNYTKGIYYLVVDYNNERATEKLILK